MKANWVTPVETEQPEAFQENQRRRQRESGEYHSPGVGVGGCLVREMMHRPKAVAAGLGAVSVAAHCRANKVYGNSTAKSLDK